jgi:outer membrane immunogenic protein
MHRLLVSAMVVVSTVALTQLASAADLPAKAPVYKAPVAQPYNWTGFYVGVNVGGHRSGDSDPAFDSFDSDFGPPQISFFNGLLPHSLSPSGIAGGAQIGYNWQISNFLLGVEADFDGLSGSRTRTLLGEFQPLGFGNTFQFSDTASDRWMSTVRARVGVLATDRLLIFATGGVAFASWNLSHSFVGGPNLFIPPASIVSETVRTGWTAGGGIEYALTQNWFLRGEYLYANFGKTTNVLNAPSAFPPFTTQFTYPETLSENLARVAISYKLGGQ